MSKNAYLVVFKARKRLRIGIKAVNLRAFLHVLSSECRGEACFDFAESREATVKNLRNNARALDPGK